MEELLELLSQIEAGELSSLNDEELGQLHDDLVAQADALMENDPTDEQLEALDRVPAALEAVAAETQARDEAESQRAERVQSIRDRIHPPEEASDTPPEETPAEEEPAEGDPPAESEPEPEAVAATARPRVSRVAARRPELMNPRQRRTRSGPQPLSIVAAANLADIPAGAPLDDPDDLARAFIAAYDMSRGYRGPRAKVPVARIGRTDPADLFGEERTLRMGSPEENTRKVAAVTSVDSITAAGGICAPTEVRYDVPIVGDDSRPVRDDLLTRFGADRGGVRTLPPPILTDMTGAVGAWTNTIDTTPGAQTKPCLTVTCPSADETVVEAITQCLQFGNFRARFFPEQVRAWLELAAVWHARFAERRLLTTIGADADAVRVTSGTLLGASVDILTTLDRAVASFRDRHRIADSFPFRLGMQRWVIDLIRADVVRQAPGTGTMDEKMAAADAMIERWIETRGVNVTWTMDGETGQEFGAQGDGPLAGWPTRVYAYLFPEGSWLFLDGGMLDLGIVRDSTLNDTNDYQVFAETFEAAHFHGVETQRIDMDVCPDGSLAALVDISPCTTGS